MSPRFVYSGADDRGATRRGEVEGSDLFEAVDRLRAEGVAVSEIQPRTPAAPPPLEAVDDFIHFNRSLAEMTALGLPLPRAVRDASAGLRRGRFKDALVRVEARLRDGRPLSEAAGELGETAPRYYRALLEAGAAGAPLTGVLSAVVRNAEATLRAKRALAVACAYPAFILAVGVLLVSAFGAFFVPVIGDLYRAADFESPITVRAMLALMGSPLRQAALGAVVLAALWTTARGLHRTARGQRLLLRVPLLGGILRRLAAARLAGALSGLLRARVPLPKALPLAMGASGLRDLDAEASRAAQRAGEGSTLSAVLRATPLMEPGATAYLALAEKTGRVPEAAEEVSELLLDRVAADSRLLLLVAAPAALILVGLFVALLAATVISPYYAFAEHLAR